MNCCAEARAAGSGTLRRGGGQPGERQLMGLNRPSAALGSNVRRGPSATTWLGDEAVGLAAPPHVCSEPVADGCARHEIDGARVGLAVADMGAPMHVKRFDVATG